MTATALYPHGRTAVLYQLAMAEARIALDASMGRTILGMARPRGRPTRATGPIVAAILAHVAATDGATTKTVKCACGIGSDRARLLTRVLVREGRLTRTRMGVLAVVDGGVS